MSKIPAHLGGGFWNVIDGVKLNDKPLTKDEAVALAKHQTGELMQERKGVDGELKDLQAELAALQLEHDNAVAAIEAQKERLSALPQLIAAARSAAEAKRRQLAFEQADATVAEFFEVAAALDRAETPELLSQWRRLVAQLRAVGRLGQSHESCEMTLRRLHGEPGLAPMRNMRTWSAVAHSWVRLKVAA